MIPNEIKNFCFDASLSTREQVIDYLQTLPMGTAHPFTSSDGQKRELLYHKASGGSGLIIDSIDITDIDYRSFLNMASLSQVEEIVAAACQKYSELQQFRDFSIQFAKPGTRFTVQISVGQIFAFVVSNKQDSNYFDFVAQDLKFNCNYSSRTAISGIQHSGDVGSLLHTLQVSHSNEPFKVLLAAIGYRVRYLRLFIDQVPTFIIVDNPNKVLHMVPVPLDKSTIGDSTFSGMVVAKKFKEGSENLIEISILSAPVCASGKDTSHHCRDQVNQAWQDARRIVSAPPSVDAEMVETRHTTSPTSSSIKMQRIDLKPIVQYIQDGISDVWELPNSSAFNFGTRVQSFESSRPAARVTLPIPFGPANGAVSALALGETPHVGEQIPSPHDLEETKLVIVHIDANWLDSIPAACKSRCNGLFIVHAGNETKASHEAVEKCLNSLCVNGLCLAGPNSVVLAKIGTELYWYQGVRWPIAMDRVPDFGEKVTDLWDRIIASCLQEPNKFPTIVNDRDQRVWLDGEMQFLDKVVASLTDKTMTFENVVNNQEDLCNVVTQISMILDPAEMLQMVTKISSSLENLITAKCQPFADEAMSYRNNNKDFDVAKLQQLMGAYKGHVRTLRKQIKPLVARLDSATSKRGVSNRNGDLKRLERKNATSNNVQKVQSMSLEEKLQFLEDTCQDIGLFIACVDAEPFRQTMDAVAGSEDDFNELLTSKPPNNIIRTHPRIGVALDALTTACMIEQCQDNHSHPLAAPKSNAIAFVPSSAYEDMHTSAVPIVCRDENVNCKDFKNFHWPDHALKLESSTWRIMFGNAIVCAYSNRNRNISPKHPNVRWFMCHLLLSVLEEIKGIMSNVPDPDVDFDDTNCQILRGVLGELLCVFGSGADRPLSMLWQWFKPNSSLVNDLTAMEQSFLVRMLEIVPYTCLPWKILRRNCRRFLIKTIRKHVTEPVTQPLQKATSQIDAQTAEKHAKLRNEELAWLRLAVSFILDLSEKEKASFLFAEGNKDNQAVATRLLQEKPPDYDHELVHNINAIANGTFDWTNAKKVKDLRQVAFNLYIKRGGPFKKCLQKLAHEMGKQKTINAQKVKEFFSNGYQELLQKHGVDFVKWQNKNGRHDNPTRANLYGDAERYRLPWHVESARGILSDKESRRAFRVEMDRKFEEKRRAILEETAPTTGNDSHTEKSEKISIKFEDRLQKEVGAVGIPAVALYKRVSDPAIDWTNIIPKDNAQINYKAFVHIAKKVGYGDLNDIVRQISKILIENWRDPVKGEELALAKVFRPTIQDDGDTEEQTS